MRKQFLGALVAGATGQFLATPADMCRVRIQMEGKRKLLGLEPRVTSLRSAFKSAWAQGGITGLYKGMLENNIGLRGFNKCLLLVWNSQNQLPKQKVFLV